MAIIPEVSDSVIIWTREGRCLPAIVVEVLEPENHLSMLTLFVIDSSGLNWYRNIPYGIGAFGHWSWADDARAFRARLAETAQVIAQ